MSSTTSALSAPTNGCAANLYDTPVHDAVCALPYSKNSTDIMIACCGKADVVSYYNDCGLYCLAIDQTVGDLISCFLDKGASDASVFCRGKKSATATGEDKVPAATASASVVHSAGSSTSTDSSDSESSSDSSSASKSSTSSGSKSTGSGNAAPGSHPQPVVTTIGLVIGALLFSATTFGAFQI
ncbi:hypothetical protein BGZ63DRAFT_390678 [Mariannaea sp. PMI_226]|nr:hypothetical protein BGZ63DRAFT_390678 [Mariannaea sp. PMI_226]